MLFRSFASAVLFISSHQAMFACESAGTLETIRSVNVKFDSVSACLTVTLYIIFPWNCFLARRHNLTFEKGQLPVFKGLNIDSSWRLTDISFVKTDLIKEFLQVCVCEREGKSQFSTQEHWVRRGRHLTGTYQPSLSPADSFCLPSCQDGSTTPYRAQCDNYKDVNTLPLEFVDDKYS